MEFWNSVLLRMGAMISAGIFTLIGETPAFYGSTVYISSIIGCVIALFIGY